MKQRIVLARLALLALLWSVAATAGPARSTAPFGAERGRGVIPFSAAAVTHSPGQPITVTWAGTGIATVTIYADTTPSVRHLRLVGRGKASGQLRVVGLAEVERWYFELVPDHGAPLVVAERSLNLATAPNFRDVGGYRATDGRWVRSGVLFRSDRLDRLSDADLERIARLGPSLIVDLRTDRERRRGIDRIPPAAEHLIADVYADADVPDNIDPLAQVTTRAEAVAFLVSANRKFVSMSSARAAYGSLFAHVGVAPGPVIYHCTAGKDRTGWATAVLLTILGVPRSVVTQDYLASNDYLAEANRRRFERLGADRERLEPVYSVSADYLDAAFEEVTAAYGSFDRYLEEALGVDQAAVAALRARYLVGEPIR